MCIALTWYTLSKAGCYLETSDSLPHLLHRCAIRNVLFVMYHVKHLVHKIMSVLMYFYVTTVIGVVQLLVMTLQPSSEVGIIASMASGMNIAKTHLNATF